MPGPYTPPFQLGGNPQGFLDRVGGQGGFVNFLQSLNPVPAPIGGGTLAGGTQINNSAPPPTSTSSQAPGLSAAPAPTAEASTGGSQTQQNQPAQPQATSLPAVSIPSNFLPGAPFGGSIQAHYQAYAAWAQSKGYTPIDFNEWKKLSNKFGGVQPEQANTPPPPTPPGSTPPPTPNAPGTIPGAPLRPDVNPFAFPDLLEQIRGAFGGLTLGNPQTTGLDPNFRGNIFNALGGPFANGPLGLPGREADAAGSHLLNVLFNEVSKQQPRAEERESLLRGLAEFLGTSQAALLNQQNLGAAGELTAPGALDALTARRTEDLNQSLASAENAAQNRLRESGVLGQGRSAATPLNALQAQLANVRRKGMLDISEQEERDRLSRLGAANQTAGVGTDITRALQQDPVNALISTLGQAQNPAVGAYADFLNQMLGLTAGQALSNRGGTFFEQISPLLGAGIGAIGQIASAPSGGGTSRAQAEFDRLFGRL